MAAVVAAIRPPGKVGLGHRLLAMHPMPAERVATLRWPERAAATGFVDGLVTAFLVGLVQPMLAETLYVWLTGSRAATWTVPIQSAALGVILTLGIGLGLCRQAAAFAVTGRPAPWLPAAVGVLVGFPVGRICSVGVTGVGRLAGVAHPTSLAVTAIALAMAIAIIASIGERLVDAAGRLRSTHALSVAAAALSTIVFALVLSVAVTAETLVDAGGRDPLQSWFWWASGAWWRELAIALLATSIVWSSRPAPVVPAWLFDPPEGSSLGRPVGQGAGAVTGLIAGASAVAVMLTCRWFAGDTVDLDDAITRLERYRWLGAFAAAGAAVVLVVRSPRRGAGSAMLAGPLAGAVTATRLPEISPDVMTLRQKLEVGLGAGRWGGGAAGRRARYQATSAAVLASWSEDGADGATSSGRIR